MDALGAARSADSEPIGARSTPARAAAASSMRWIVIAVATSGIVFAFDAQIPPEVAISPLYLFPVGAVAWRAGRWWGLAMAVVASAEWIGAEIISGVTYTNDFIYVWNTLMRFGTFAVVATLLATVRTAHEEYRRLSRTDPATGILNSRTFQEGLAHEIERARRHRGCITLIYIDLDDFKQVNDRFGHSAGDAVLAAVAGELTARTRCNDLVARVGGDEFAVLLVEVDAPLVPEALARLQQGLTAAMSAPNWPISFSIGAVTFTTPPASAETAMHAADEAMYHVKRGSKNAIRHEVRSD